MNIGEKIRAARHAKGLTQDELAELVGVDPPTVSRWENNVSHPRPGRIPKLSEVLGLSDDWLAASETNIAEYSKSLEARLEALEKRLPEPAPAPIPINKAEIEELRAQVQELTEKLKEKERLIGPHALLLKELKTARPAQVASAYAPFPGLEVPEGVIGEDK